MTSALGQGIPVAGGQDLEWYGQAAALGNAHAMRGLGLTPADLYGAEP